MSMNKTTGDLQQNFLRRMFRANLEPPDVDRKGSWAMQSRRFSGLPLIGILSVIYFIAGKLGLMLASLHASASPVWPPAGIALAALLLLGYRAWPAIFIGAFLVNVTTAGNVATSFAIATGNTLEALVGAWLVNRFAGRSEEHTSELQSQFHLVCRLLLE